MSLSQERLEFLRKLREEREKMAKKVTPQERNLELTQLYVDAALAASKPKNAKWAETLRGITKLAEHLKPP